MKLNNSNFFFATLLSLISAVTFILIIRNDYPDIADHNRFIISWLGGDTSVKLYSLYYYVLLVFSFFTDNLQRIHVVSVIILVLSVIAKYFVAGNIFKKEILAVNNNVVLNGNRRLSTQMLGAMVLFFICIAQNLIYKPSATMSLGYLPVNTWHNSTTIFLMPFALILFYSSYKFFKDFGSIQNSEGMYPALLRILMLTILTVFIKPSYFFVFAVAFPLFWLMQFGINLRLVLTGLVSLVSGLALIVIYKYVFTGSDSSVIIDPFHVWSFWSSNIPLSLLASILFPLLFLVFYPGLFRANMLLRYGWINFIIAIIIYSLLTETGEREIHGNFSWQNVVCNFILFLVTSIAYFPIIVNREKLLLKDKVLLLVFAGHVITGCIFLAKLPLFGAR